MKRIAYYVVVWLFLIGYRECYRAVVTRPILDPTRIGVEIVGIALALTALNLFASKVYTERGKL